MHPHLTRYLTPRAPFFALTPCRGYPRYFARSAISRAFSFPGCSIPLTILSLLSTDCLPFSCRTQVAWGRTTPSGLDLSLLVRTKTVVTHSKTPTKSIGMAKTKKTPEKSIRGVHLDSSGCLRQRESVRPISLTQRRQKIGRSFLKTDWFVLRLAQRRLFRSPVVPKRSKLWSITSMETKQKSFSGPFSELPNEENLNPSN